MLRWAGTAEAYQDSLGSEPILIAAALAAVYIILAILYESCLARSRSRSTGTGAEFRRPPGITIIGALIASQLLTLYTTPVVYVCFDSDRQWLGHSVAGAGLIERPRPTS